MRLTGPIRKVLIALTFSAVATGAYLALPPAPERSGCKPLAVSTSAVTTSGKGPDAHKALLLSAQVRGDDVRTAEVTFELLRDRSDAEPLYGGSGVTDAAGKATFDAGLGIEQDEELVAQLAAAKHLRVGVDLRFRGFCEAQQVVPFSYMP